MIHPNVIFIYTLIWTAYKQKALVLCILAILKFIMHTLISNHNTIQVYIV